MDNIFELIFERYRVGSLQAAQTAELLNSAIRLAFSKRLMFFYELLQNAADSPLEGKTDDHIAVQIYFFSDWVLIQHNGMPFSAADVLAISRFGNVEYEEQFEHQAYTPKSHNINKIGYKGIGFKSVFTVTDCCYVISGNYQFRFDKNYTGWDCKPYPWQITPIPTELDAIPENIKTYVTDSLKTSILLRANMLTDINKIKDEILRDRILLFLCHIKSIKISNGDTNTVIRILERIQEQEMVSITTQTARNQPTTNHFIVENFYLNIPQEVRDSVATLDNVDCPPKLKEAETITISLAAEMENDKKLKDLEGNARLLYTYLPTKATLPFPFTINAQFLLNKQRTALLDNQLWNAHIFSNLAEFLLKWMQKIALSNAPFKFQFLKLLRKAFENERDIYGYRVPYNRALSSKLSEIRFIPPQNEDRDDLLLVEESIIDYTGFNKEFNTTTDAARVLKKEQADIAHKEIYKIEKLLDIGASKFGNEELWALLKSVHFVNSTEVCIKIVDYLHDYLTNLANPESIAQLLDIPFLLDKNNIWQTPEDVFMPTIRELLPDGLEVEIQYLHNDIVKHLNQKPGLKYWLSEVGVKEPTIQGMARKVINTYLHDTDGINHNTALILGRYFFSIYRALSETELQTLRQKLPVVCTNNQLLPAQSCYLANAYDPELPLEDYISPNGTSISFVSPQYAINGNKLIEWKQFWKKIGIGEKMTKVQIPPTPTGEKISRTALLNQLPEIEAYFSFLDEKPEYNPGVRNFRNEPDQHQIRNLYAVTFIEKTENNPQFAQTFWTLLISSGIINQNRDKTEYFHRLNQQSKHGEVVPTYVQFFARKKRCLPDTNNTCRVSGELFSPNLIDLVKDVFPVVNLRNLNREWAEYLGIKTQLSFNDCLIILQYCTTLPVDNNLITRIENIYKYIIEILKSHTSTEDRKEAQLWQGNLLAADNTFKNPSELYFFNLKGVPLPNNRESFLKDSNLSYEVMLQIATLFNLQIISPDELKLNPTGEQESNELKSLLKSRVGFLSKFIHHKTGNLPEIKKAEMLQRLNDITFYACSNLEITYENNPNLYQRATVAYYAPEYAAFYHIQHWRNAENLMPLSKQLSVILQIQAIEFELQLFLTHDDGSIARWLRSLGIDVRDEIGKIGENITFNLLRKELKRNYPSTLFEESENSVFVKQEANILVTLSWNNQDEEAYLPYDFKIESNNEGEAITTYIEVKTTSDETNDIIYLTPTEWECMIQNPNNYTIYRVYLSAQENYQLRNYQIIKRPLQYLQEGKLQLLDITGFVNMPPNNNTVV